MKYRKLRIAWSVACGIVAVLLCVLWVRSQSIEENVSTPFPYDFSFGSGLGVLGIGWCDAPDSVNRWYVSRFTAEEAVEDEPLPYSSHLWGGFVWSQDVYKGDKYQEVLMPHWFAIGIAAGTSAVPWLRWSNRFSLRTLLLATTLVAVGLGLIVWLTR